jgi:alpha-tubulin suppressor-like RCC1 family protein
MDTSAALALAAFDTEDTMVHRNHLYTWGSNQLGQTGHTGTHLPDPRAWRVQRSPRLLEEEHFKGDPALVRIACGLQHTGAVSKDGQLFMWGSNESGQVRCRPLFQLDHSVHQVMELMNQAI